MQTLNPLEHAAVGPRIRELREAKGISLRRLARRAGISRSALSKIERDVVPSIENVQRIAVGLDIGLTELWIGEDLDDLETRGTGIELAAGSRGRNVMRGDGMLRCTHSFSDVTTITEGDVLHESHPIVGAHRDAFEYAD